MLTSTVTTHWFAPLLRLGLPNLSLKPNPNPWTRERTFAVFKWVQ